MTPLTLTDHAIGPSPGRALPLAPAGPVVGLAPGRVLPLALAGPVASFAPPPTTFARAGPVRVLPQACAYIVHHGQCPFGYHCIHHAGHEAAAQARPFFPLVRYP